MSSAVKTVHHVCTGCGAAFPHSFTTFCNRCGAMIDIRYDLGRVVFRSSEDSFVRYFDLLPLESTENLTTYGAGPTPCHHAGRLGDALGLPWLYIKDESVLPTGTTKDRMAVVVLSFLRECGITEFCTASTGNSSTALANLIGRCPEMRMYLFSGDEFSHRVNFASTDQVTHFVLRDATFVEAFEFAAEFARRNGLLSERGFFNPARREGLKLAFLEAVEQVPRPIDWYVQAVSSAMGVYGTWKGAVELVELSRIARPPRLLCVQQETCSPMASAFAEGSETIEERHIVERPTGIASAILRGNPSRVYPIVRRIVLESEGAFASVSEAEIREARRMAEELEGLTLCFSSAAAIAGVARLARRGELPAGHTVLVNLTGRDRDETAGSHEVRWLRRSNGTWVPEAEGEW